MEGGQDKRGWREGGETAQQAAQKLPEPWCAATVSPPSTFLGCHLGEVSGGEQQKEPAAGGGCDAGDLEALSRNEPEQPVTRQGASRPGDAGTPSWMGQLRGAGTGAKAAAGLCSFPARPVPPPPPNWSERAR